MRTNILRAVAVSLGISVCTIAQAQSTYNAPAKWNNFRPISDKGKAAAKEEPVELELPAPVDELPTPVADPIPAADPAPVADADADSAPSVMSDSASQQMHTSEPVGTGCQSCESSAYSQAVAAPWAGSGRLPMTRWFGGAELLFLTLENGSGRHVANGLGDYNTSLVDPSATVGFDVSVGRYLDCGRFGLGVTYMLWNPSAESVIRSGTAGTITATMPAYRDISINADGAGIDTMYNYINGSGPVAGAAAIRTSRDLMFQGIEVNLFSFGLMGAQRISYDCCNSGTCFGRGLGLNPCRGYGGATGPLVRACSGRVRVMTSHGFRWFQAKDELEFAYNIDGSAGYQAEDLYENVDIRNNLYGYQFGGRLTYCLSSRMNLNIGGKFGLYGNHAEMRHRVGTQTTLAYRNGLATETIDTESSDTVLSTLGELDLGLGYRLGCAWTIRGGYRLFGVTGVATAVDSLPGTYASLASSAQVHANDSYVLHGGYLGLEFNW